MCIFTALIMVNILQNSTISYNFFAVSILSKRLKEEDSDIK